MAEESNLELASRWTSTWAAGWATHDPDLVASAYAEDALYVSHPFRDPVRARDYAAGAFAEEEAVELWFAEPHARGREAAVEYWALIRHDGGKVSTLAGVSLLRFDEAGLVARHYDYWAMEETERRPPPHWGPVAVHRHGDF